MRDKIITSDKTKGKLCEIKIGTQKLAKLNQNVVLCHWSLRLSSSGCCWLPQLNPPGRSSGNGA